MNTSTDLTTGFEAHVKPRPESGHVLVRVIGEVDIFSQAEFTQALTRAADSDAGAPQSVVVDLSDVRFFAAAGVHCLRAVETLLDPPARLHLVCPQPYPVRRILTLLELDHRWLMHTCLADAVTSRG